MLTAAALAQELTHTARRAIPENRDDADTITDAHTLAETLADDPATLDHPDIMTDAQQILDDLHALTPDPTPPADAAAAIASLRRGLARHRRDIPDWRYRMLAQDHDLAATLANDGMPGAALHTAEAANASLGRTLTNAYARRIHTAR